MNSTRIIFFNIIFFSFILLSAGHAAEPAKNKAPSPIQIEADHMLSDQKNNSVFFSGKVEAAQDDIVIHADEMTVFYINDKDTGKDETPGNSVNSSKNIKRLWAVGSVEITKEEWMATGDTAEYFESERKIVLTGNTKVWQDNNLVTGDKFIMYLDEEKSIVESSADKNERVKAFFYPNSK